MARWDDLRRAILARDSDAVERIWFELLEADPKDPQPFLEAADLQARQTGGKRFASSLLGLLVDAFREHERWFPLIPVYARLAAYAADEGDLRTAVIEAAGKAYPDRRDLDVLLEKSQVQGGTPQGLESQIELLQHLLQIEKDAWVYHKSGWGVGQVVEYYPERGRCVIDFRERPGHEMDVEAAARLLDRLQPDDIRVQAMVDPRALRKRAKEEPLEMLRQVLARYNNRCLLRNVKDSLVPDAVATSTWSTWWKDAKKHALLDPRFNVGPGRDPRIAFHDIAQADFPAQVERALKSQATASGRQKALQELARVMGANEEAKAVLTEAAQRELKITRDPADRAGWVILHAQLTGTNAIEQLTETLGAARDPVAVVSGIEDDSTRAEAARALVRIPETGPAKLLEVVLNDDAVVGRVAAETLSTLGHPEIFEDLLDQIDKRPAQWPNLYAWYCRGLKRGRWRGREYDPGALILRVLKVMDAVEYRVRRGGDPKDKAAVSRLIEILTEKNCDIAQQASQNTDEAAAHHLLQMLAQNRGLRGRALERLQDTILHDHPGALREAPRQEEEAQQIYMTAQGIEALREAYERITNREMPENAREIARAREFGDLSENAEYHAAREKQSLLQAKADALKADLARAVPIKPEIVRTDAVSVGSRVLLRDSQGDRISYTLLGPPDANVQEGVINYLTPLGQALMGQAAGDHVRLDVDGRVRELEVLAIENALR
jgi:transcription elongation factor GreA